MEPRELTMADAMLAAAGGGDQARAVPRAPAQASLTGERTSLRRGFLLAGGAPKPPRGAQPTGVLPEVQDAMARAPPPLAAAGGATWLTAELLAAVAAHPVLAAGLSDPAVTALLPRLQRDPQGVIQEHKVRARAPPPSP